MLGTIGTVPAPQDQCQYPVKQTAERKTENDMDRSCQNDRCITMKATYISELESTTLAAITRRSSTAEVSLSEARTALACDAQSSDAKSLARRLNTLAELEGRLFVFRTLIYLNANDRAGEIRNWLMEQAIRGADDSWSGRINDVARARHDGVLRAIREVDQELNGI